MNYIISLVNTKREDSYISLWRDDNAGYCYKSEEAGVYKDTIPGYHNSFANMSIPVSEAEKLLIISGLEGQPAKVLPNCIKVWNALNVIMTPNGLKKKCNQNN